MRHCSSCPFWTAASLPSGLPLLYPLLLQWTVRDSVQSQAKNSSIDALYHPQKQPGKITKAFDSDTKLVCRGQPALCTYAVYVCVPTYSYVSPTRVSGRMECGMLLHYVVTSFVFSDLHTNGWLWRGLVDYRSTHITITVRWARNETMK